MWWFNIRRRLYIQWQHNNGHTWGLGYIYISQADPRSLPPQPLPIHLPTTLFLVGIKARPKTLPSFIQIDSFCLPCKNKHFPKYCFISVHFSISKLGRLFFFLRNCFRTAISPLIGPLGIVQIAFQYIIYNVNELPRFADQSLHFRNYKFDSTVAMAIWMNAWCTTWIITAFVYLIHQISLS